MAGDDDVAAANNDGAAGSSAQKYHTNLLPDKLELTRDRGDAFVVWEQRWKDYSALSGLAKRTPGEKMALLRACVSDDTLKVMMNLNLPEPDNQDPDKIIAELKKHSHGKINVVIERRNFNMRNQLEGENFDDYLTCLRELVKTCAFCDDCRDTLIRDRIITGILDGDIVEKLLAMDENTLADVIKKCQVEEAARKYRTEIVGGASMNRVSTYRYDKKQAAQYKSNTPRNAIWDPCFNCTRKHEAGMYHCPAKDVKCARCGQTGHYAKAVRCPNNDGQNQGSSENEISSIEVYNNMGSIIASVRDSSRGTDPEVHVAVDGDIANGASVQVTPDSGADQTAFAQFKNTGIDEMNLQEPNIKLKADDGHVIYWPSMDSDIESVVRGRTDSQKVQTSQCKKSILHQGHPNSDSLSIHQKAFAPEWQKSFRDAEVVADHIKMSNDQSAHRLPGLPLGAPVLLKRWYPPNDPRPRDIPRLRDAYTAHVNPRPRDSTPPRNPLPVKVKHDAYKPACVGLQR